MGIIFNPHFLGSFWVFLNSVEGIIFRLRGVWGKLEGDKRFVLLCGWEGGAVLSRALKAPFVRPRRGPGALGGTGAWQILKPTARPGRAATGSCPLLIPNSWRSSGHRGLCWPSASWQHPRSGVWDAQLGMQGLGCSAGCGVWDAGFGMHS